MIKTKNISSKLKLNALFLILTLLSIISLTLAEETLPSPTPPTAFQQDEKEFQDATLSTSAGITPDSPLYFIDNLLDNFATDASNREEKIAEIQDMIKAGKVDDAKKALSRYQQFAKRTEQDISPDQQEQTRKSAVAISHVIKKIKDDIPAEHQQEFVTDILSQEEKISTAAKVADKIKNLCETLSKLDPQQYAKTCKLDDNEDAPQWQRRLDDKLTSEQQVEARAFFKTMSGCMRDPANCQCDEISIKPLAEKCKVIAPLAGKCKQGDQASCDAMDKDTENIEDLLPPHLQDIMKDIETDFSGAEFENHMPPECQQANIDPKSSNAREQCEEVMFKQNAPEECIQAGLKDHKECSKYMFNLKAPPECKDAGLTGESQKDHRQCEKIMQELQQKQQPEFQNNNPTQNNNFNPSGPGMGFSFGKNCKDLTDQNEKLQCLEQFYTHAQQQQNNVAPPQQEFQNQQSAYPQENNQQGQFQNNYPPNFQQNNKNFDPSRVPPECRDTTSPDECRKIMDEKSRQYQQENENKYRNENNNPAFQPNFHGNAIYPSPDQYQNKENRQNCDCRNVQCSPGSYPACEPGSNSCNCRQFENQQQPYPQPQNPDQYQQPPYPEGQQPPNMNQPNMPPPNMQHPQPGMQQPPNMPPPDMMPPPQNQQQPPSDQQQQQPRPSESPSPPPPSSPEHSESSESKESSSNSPESSPITGGAIIDNKFLKYYWKRW